MDGGLLSLKWNNHKTTFFHVLSNIRKKEAYCDATLACDGRFYPVHKLILSTCSDYFEQMFEKTKDKQPVIVLKDIRHEDLEALLNYMYLGEVNVLQNDLSGLIKSAECLRIKGLAVPDEDPNEKKDNKRLWEGDSHSDGKRQRREERDRQEERREERRREERREEERREEKRREERREERRQQEYSNSLKESSREPSRTDLVVASSPSQSLSASRSPEPSRNSSSHNSITSNEVPEQAEAATPMVVLDEDQPMVKEEPPSEVFPVEDSTDYMDGSVDNKEDLQGSFEAPNLVGDIASSLGYDQQSLRAGQPQSMEDLVAQVMPGSSGMQGKAWEGSNQSLVGLGYNENYSEDGQQTAPMDGLDGNEVWTAYQGAGVGVACPFCGKVFHQRYSFVNHYRTHTGLKPFVCPFCSHGFIQKGNLKTHILRHHSTKPDGDPQATLPSTFIPRKTSNTLITALPSPILPQPIIHHTQHDTNQVSVLSSKLSALSALRVGLPNLPITPPSIPLTAFSHSPLHSPNRSQLVSSRSFSPVGLASRLSSMVAPPSPSPGSIYRSYESPSRNYTPPLSLLMSSQDRTEISNRELMDDSQGSKAPPSPSPGSIYRSYESPRNYTPPLSLVMSSQDRTELSHQEFVEDSQGSKALSPDSASEALEKDLSNTSAINPLELQELPVHTQATLEQPPPQTNEESSKTPQVLSTTIPLQPQELPSHTQTIPEQPLQAEEGSPSNSSKDSAKSEIDISLGSKTSPPAVPENTGNLPLPTELFLSESQTDSELNM